VGRQPTREISALAERDSLIRVTGTVPDVRPYLWNAAVSVVPLRIGGGTRMKIYEAMAARAPVVSTTIGAEGLEIDPPRDIRIANNAADFATQCIDLLTNETARECQANAAWELVSTRFGWQNIAQQFTSILEAHSLRSTRG
jgi:glycosyltransferase involved in cell wall biosynthesis